MLPIRKERASGDPPSRPDSFPFPAIPCCLACHPRTGRQLRLAARICIGIVLLSALGVPPADAGTMPTRAPSVFETSDPFASWIAQASRRFDIPAAWLRAVIRVESRGDARAVSAKGAMGLMQLMPATWEKLRLRYGLGADPFDPRDNILAGAAYLRELHDRYSAPGFLAAYNAGPARYEASLATGRALPGETRAYVGALAPLTGSGTAEVHGIVEAAALLWNAAPLFVLHTASFSPLPRPWSAVQHERSSVVAQVADVTGFAPQSTGLFVPVSLPSAMQ